MCSSILAYRVGFTGIKEPDHEARGYGIIPLAHPFGGQAIMNLIEVMDLSEDGARAYLESRRWPDGPVCPHCCYRERIYKLNTARKGLYKCAACRKQFSVTVRTVMHGSHITHRQWVLAFHLICSSKKGLSAAQLQRNLGLKSYKSAWYMSHRIRIAMHREPFATLLRGTVEVDETYVGGKPRAFSKRGRGTRKAPVLVMLERNGRAVAGPVEKVDARTLKGAIRRHVDRRSKIVTDEWGGYRGIGREFEGGHSVVLHRIRQYVNGDAYTNTAESFFALLKRGVHGTFHHVSKKHLALYCEEFSFRWNTSKLTDSQRMEKALESMGRRYVSYKELVGN